MTVEDRDRWVVVVPLRPPAAPLPVRLVRAGTAAAAGVARAADQALGGSGRVPTAADVAVGALAIGTDVAGVLVDRVSRVLGPLAAVLVAPPLVPATLTPRHLVRLVADRGRHERAAGAAALDVAAQTLVPAVVDAALDRIDLTDLVVRHVDLAGLVTAVLERVDLPAVVAEQVDVPDVLAAALDRVDLTELVVQRVALDLVVQAALDRLDLTALVLDRVALDRVVEVAVERVDLTALVREHVDLDALVATVDLQAVVDRLDLVGIANYVVDEIDLPEIVRESTGGVASEAVRGVRMQSVEADERVSRIVDRILLRRKARKTDAPGEPESLAADKEGTFGG